MLRTVAWYTNLAASLIVKIPAMYKVKRLGEFLDPLEKDKLVHKLASKWAVSQVKMSGATVKVEGQENVPKEGAVVFVSNHQGNFDIPLLLGYIDKPKGYIAKSETEKMPLISAWMKHLNCVFMDRSSPRKSSQAIIEGIDILKDGHSLVIFPEGTRSKSNKMGEFKPGSFKLATKAKVPIVPVTIKGSYKIMEQNDNKIKPAQVELYIHPPIETANLSKEEEAELPDKVKEIISKSL